MHVTMRNRGFRLWLFASFGAILLDGCELGPLHVADLVAALVAEHNHRKRRGETEAGRHRK